MPELLPGLILLPHLRVQNANAISSPLTWGFPAISAFLGFAHALQRRLGKDVADLEGVGVVCHTFTPQTYRPHGRYHRRFCLPRHPLNKQGASPGTVEEGRTHLEVSLLLGIRDHLDEKGSGAELARLLLHTALGMRLAGGSLLPASTGRGRPPRYFRLGDDLVSQQNAFRKIRRALLPGFALLDRSDLLAEHLAQLRQDESQATALDALLDLSRLKVEPLPTDPAADAKPSGQVVWQASRVRPGWLVPLPVGFGAISPLHPPGTVQNARDMTTPFRFVEALYSLGEWVSPHRLESPQEILWHYQARPAEGIYLCQQNQPLNKEQ